MGTRGLQKKRRPKHQRLFKLLAIILTGAFVVNFVQIHTMLHSDDWLIHAPILKLSRTLRDRVSLQSPASPARERRISRVSLKNPQQSKLQRLEALESKLGSYLNLNLNQSVVSCTKENENSKRATERRCDAYLHDNDTDPMLQLVIYNPLPRDQFLCGGTIILGPEKWKKLDIATARKCRFGIESRSYSFPYPPTFENRGQFPGIHVQKKAHAMDDTFSSGFESKRNRNDFGTFGCDVKCQVDVNSRGNVHIDGMDAVVTFSMEGEVSRRLI